MKQLRTFIAKVKAWNSRPIGLEKLVRKGWDTRGW